MILDEFARFFVHAQQAVVFQVCAEDLFMGRREAWAHRSLGLPMFVRRANHTFASGFDCGFDMYAWVHFWVLSLHISLQGGLKFCLACSHGGDWWWASRMPCAAGMA